MTQEAALTIMKTGANVFLTGEPGSGKTHTVNAYIRYLSERGIAASITASTGIAATHVGGLTIHSWSGIGIKRFLSEADLDDMEAKEPLVKRLRNAKVLIIDEISMLDGSTLDMVDRALRALRRAEEAFGGLQTIFVGDFFQLPPVSRMGDAPAKFAFDALSWRRANPLVCYLSEQHRQEDRNFLSTLSAIRRGEIEDAVYECLSERKIEADEHPRDIPRLYTHNIDVDKKNAQELAKLPGAAYAFAMTSEGRPLLIEALKKGCLSPETLELKIGASVMFTRNNFDTGYVNGTLGTVESFDEDTGFPIVRTKKGESITATPAEWAVEDGGKTLAKVMQVPLRLAWAITVHKSQGMSMDAAVMDLSQSFEYGQGYVALSRVRRLSGVHLVGINSRALLVHPLVLERDESFREASHMTEDAFMKIERDQLETMHKNFVEAMGGKWKSVKKKTRIFAAKHGKRWSEDEESKLRELFAEGMKMNDIAKELGREKGGIRSRLIKIGLLEEPMPTFRRKK